MFYEKELISLYDRFSEFKWENESVYAEYLAQSFYYIRHSTKMLALSAGYIGFDDAKVFRRMVRHIGEEMSHEILCTRDLEVLGKSLDTYEEMPATQSLYQPQYYKIQHQNPTAYLGYIYVLESICCSVVPKVLTKKLNPIYPEGATSFLRLHGEEDPDHLEKAKETISSLNEENRKAVAQNMLHTIEAYKHFLNSIEARWSHKN